MYNIVKNYPRYESIESKDVVKKLFNSRRLLDLPAPNTCAIRVSEALNKAGFTIDGTNLPKNEYEKGKNGKWYVLTAMGMKRYLEKKYGGLARYYVNTPELYRRFRQYIDVLGSGIVILQSNSKSFTGHADIWFEEKFVGKNKKRESVMGKLNQFKEKVKNAPKKDKIKEKLKEQSL